MFFYILLTNLPLLCFYFYALSDKPEKQAYFAAFGRKIRLFCWDRFSVMPLYDGADLLEVIGKADILQPLRRRQAHGQHVLQLQAQMVIVPI